MKLIYSICYPDRKEIEYFHKPISEKEALQLINEFGWEEELRKEQEFYSPSLDFIKLDNKKRCIVSGMGKGKLESFQIMYIQPNGTNSVDIFNDDNYRNGESYSKEVTLEEGFRLLDDYFNDNEIGIISVLDKDREVLNEPLTARELNVLNKEFKRGEPIKDFEDYNIFAQLFFRSLGPVLILFFFWMFLQFYSLEGNWDEGSLLFGGLSLFFLIGTIIFELNLKKK